jgi:non-specific serine/threonine protein kinase
MNTGLNNLPLALSSFIGREHEMTEVMRLLSSARLVTLTGAGGCGKTRLAIRVGAELLDRFADGVWFVNLAPLSNPELVPKTVSAPFGLGDVPGRTTTEILTSYLRERHMLLLLDNCEHLLVACAQLAESLLQMCPQLAILGTSREALGISGEMTYRVPPLTSPDPAHRLAADSLAQYEAVRLFLDRALAVQPDFRLTEQNGMAVAQVCRRLDGIPLAIELAAARIRSLPVEQIAARLDDRFRLLTGGSRTALPRQQTLRATVDWSYNLLPEAERLLLGRLSVFAGGWTLEAAEEVCGDERLAKHTVADTLLRLTDQSLVLASPQAGEARFRMLETFRQYAHEKLTEAGEVASLRDRHLDFYLHLLERAFPQMLGAEQIVWYRLLELEIDNVRTAFDWSFEADHVLVGLRMAAALRMFWYSHGYHREGRERLRKLLAHPGASAPTAERARGLMTAGIMTFADGDFAEARPLLDEALALGRALDDVARTLDENSITAWSLHYLGHARYWDSQYYLGFTRMLGRSQLSGMGAEWEESLALARQFGYGPLITRNLVQLGWVADLSGDWTRGRSLLEEGLGLSKAMGDLTEMSKALRALARPALQRGDAAQAAAYAREDLKINRELGNKTHIMWSLVTCVVVSAARARWVEAARLLGAVQTLQMTGQTQLQSVYTIEFEDTLSAVRAQLSEAIFTRSLAEGRAMTLEQVMALALTETVEPAAAAETVQAPPTGAAGPNALTAREVEVLRLLATGLPNKEIAERLVLSTFTVRAHLRSIYAKLAVETRSAATRYALDHHLL